MTENVGITKIPTGVDLVLKDFERPYTKLHLSYRGRLRNHVMELEAQKCTAAQNTLLVGWHNVELFGVPPAEREKYYTSIWEMWREWEPPYQLCVSKPPVMSYYTGAVLERERAGTLMLRIAKT